MNFAELVISASGYEEKNSFCVELKDITCTSQSPHLTCSFNAWRCILSNASQC